MTTPVNPYIAGNPVTGEEMFFGREDVFDFIRRTLVGRHQDNIVVLYGQRRTGKTSVLYQMHRRLDETYMPVLIDLQGLSMDGMSGFLWELANIIRRTLRRRYGITMPRPQRGDFAEDPRHQFEEVFLPQVWNLIGDRRLMLMFDEAVRLEEQVEAGRLGKDVFDYLRHLMQHGERLRFIYSLGSKLEEMQKEYAVLFSVALYKVISFLERDAAVALITEPVQDVYEYEPTAVDRILQITSGHPYFTQLLCSSLFLHWQRSDGERVTVSDVEGVLDEVVEQGTAILKYAWEESSDAEKVVLAALAEAADEPNRPITEGQLSNVLQKHGIPLPPGERTRALADLVDRDIIAPAGSYVFTVDLLRIWLRKNKRVEWVRERELTAVIPQWADESQQGIAIPLPIMGEVVLTPLMTAGAAAVMVIAVVLMGLTLLGGLADLGLLARRPTPTPRPPTVTPVRPTPTLGPPTATPVPPTATSAATPAPTRTPTFTREPTQTPTATLTPSSTPTPDLRDPFEPDDTAEDVRDISLGEIQTHTFYPEGDVDTVQFLAKAGRIYRVFTRDLALGVDTHLRVEVDSDVFENDDVDPGILASEVRFQASADQTVFVTILNRDRYGPERTYGIAVEEVIPTSTPTNTRTPAVTWTPTTTSTPTSVPTSTNTPRPMATATPNPYEVAPVPISPVDGAALSGVITLQWSWVGSLGSDEHFDVRVWKPGQPAYGVAWTETPEWTGIPPHGDGEYNWQIIVIRGRDGRWEADLSPPSEIWTFSWSGGGGAPQPPTPTPR